MNWIEVEVAALSGKAPTPRLLLSTISKRKRSGLGWANEIVEYFSGYRPQDYKGLLAEWQNRQCRIGLMEMRMESSQFFISLCSLKYEIYGPWGTESSCRILWLWRWRISTAWGGSTNTSKSEKIMFLESSQRSNCSCGRRGPCGSIAVWIRIRPCY